MAFFIKEIIQNKETSEEEKAIAKSYYKDSLDSLNYFDWIDRLADFFESKEIFKHVPIKENEDK